MTSRLGTGKPLTFFYSVVIVLLNVADPDPSDPYVFGLLDLDPDSCQRYGSGSGFSLSSSNNSKKNLDSYCFVTSC